MKKWIALTVCAVILTGLVSCKAPAQSPPDAAKPVERDFAPEAGSYQEYLGAQKAVDAKTPVSITAVNVTDSEDTEPAHPCPGQP